MEMEDYYRVIINMDGDNKVLSIEVDTPSPPPPHPIPKPAVQHCKYKMQDFIRCIHFALQSCIDYVEEYCIVLSNDEDSILKQLNEVFFAWTFQIMGLENSINKDYMKSITNDNFIEMWNNTFKSCNNSISPFMDK